MYESRRLEIPEGDPGTVRTLEIMGALARDGARRPGVVETAGRVNVGGGLPALRELVGRVRFQEDPYDVEYIRAPEKLLDDLHRGRAVGDCDDVAVLAAALALAAGYSVRFVVVGFDADGPFSHVWTEAGAPGGAWYDFDTTRPAQMPAGVRFERRETFPVT